MSGCKGKGHQHTLLCRAPVNTKPITRDNMALVGYVTLVASDDLKREGLTAFARVLEKTGMALTMEHGRLPPGLYIPDELWAEVYDYVIAQFREALAKAAPTEGSA